MDNLQVPPRLGVLVLTPEELAAQESQQETAMLGALVLDTTPGPLALGAPNDDLEAQKKAAADLLNAGMKPKRSHKKKVAAPTGNAEADETDETDDTETEEPAAVVTAPAATPPTTLEVTLPPETVAPTVPATTPGAS